MGYQPVSAPGVPQQLSEPKTPWQNSSGLSQQGLPQKPRPHAELGMGMKTKTTMAAGQMWSPTPSVWLKGTHGASGKGKPAWTQQYCNRGVCPLPCPLAGSSHPCPCRTAQTCIWATQVPLAIMEAGAPQYAHGAQPCLLQARGRQPQAPPPQHPSALAHSETPEPQGKLTLQPRTPESRSHWLQGARTEMFSHFPRTAFTRAALFSFFTLPHRIEHSMQSQELV